VIRHIDDDDSPEPRRIIFYRAIHDRDAYSWVVGGLLLRNGTISFTFRHLSRIIKELASEAS
jgi:hypothetical protein